MNEVLEFVVALILCLVVEGIGLICGSALLWLEISHMGLSCMLGVARVQRR